MQDPESLSSTSTTSDSPQTVLPKLAGELSRQPLRLFLVISAVVSSLALVIVGIVYVLNGYEAFWASFAVGIALFLAIATTVQAAPPQAPQPPQPQVLGDNAKRAKIQAMFDELFPLGGDALEAVQRHAAGVALQTAVRHELGAQDLAGTVELRKTLLQEEFHLKFPRYRSDHFGLALTRVLTDGLGPPHHVQDGVRDADTHFTINSTLASFRALFPHATVQDAANLGLHIESFYVV
jgi:hypothetical protein